VSDAVDTFTSGEDLQPLTPRQRQAAKARQAFAAKFASDDEKSAHFREIGAKGNAGRLTLSGEEAQALHDAYRLLSRIAERAGEKTAATPDANLDPATT
jgi:hypothetical protein